MNKQNKKVLIKTTFDQFLECEILEYSPSGKYIKVYDVNNIREYWVSIDKIVEEFSK